MRDKGNMILNELSIERVLKLSKEVFQLQLWVRTVFAWNLTFSLVKDKSFFIHIVMCSLVHFVIRHFVSSNWTCCVCLPDLTGNTVKTTYNIPWHDKSLLSFSSFFAFNHALQLETIRYCSSEVYLKQNACSKELWDIYTIKLYGSESVYVFHTAICSELI